MPSLIIDHGKVTLNERTDSKPWNDTLCVKTWKHKSGKESDRLGDGMYAVPLRSRETSDYEASVSDE